ncbi:unnamed protein product [Linum trigynum]|uniref:Uncharacterized protein n=1 Tax=Linum trigynum TaxID=586398 RepID=A0AAV2FA15_9ROSI
MGLAEDSEDLVKIYWNHRKQYLRFGFSLCESGKRLAGVVESKRGKRSEVDEWWSRRGESRVASSPRTSV